MARADVVATIVAMVLFLVSFWFSFTSFERQYEFLSLTKNRRRAVFKTVGKTRPSPVRSVKTFTILVHSLQENAFYYNFYEDIVYAENFFKGLKLLLAHPVCVMI